MATRAGVAHNMAAYAGFDVLSVSWDTQSPFFYRCGNAPPDTPETWAGGECDPAYDCADIIHQEMWTGVDDAQTHPDDAAPWTGYRGAYWSSVERRATRALQALDEADSNDDHHWADYCEPDDTYGSRLRYEDLVIAGGSMGATQAQWVYYTRSTEALEEHIATYGDTADTGLPSPPDPPVPVHGLWGTEMFGDFCEVTDPPASSTSGRPNPYFYSLWDDDDYKDSVIRPVPIGQTFTALHADSESWPNQNHTHTDYIGLPLTFEPVGLGTQHQVYEYETETALGADKILRTTQEPPVGTSCDEHASMMADNCLPDASVTGAPVTNPGIDTHDVYLFEGYVEGLCSVGVFK